MLCLFLTFYFFILINEKKNNNSLIINFDDINYFCISSEIGKNDISNKKRELQINNMDIKTILEPSCGSCEFINYLDTKVKDTTIHCIEFNKKIYEN